MTKRLSLDFVCFDCVGSKIGTNRGTRTNAKKTETKLEQSIVKMKFALEFVH